MRPAWLAWEGCDNTACLAAQNATWMCQFAAIAREGAREAPKGALEKG